MASGSNLYLKAGEYFYMKKERLESALEWCRRNNVESNRLKKFNRESKKYPTFSTTGRELEKKKHIKKNQNRGKTITRPKNLSNY